VSQSLGVVESLLYKWKAEQTGDTRPSSTWEKSESEVEKELLRGKIKQLELERDILKKALGIFNRVN
jgi:transposase